MPREGQAWVSPRLGLMYVFPPSPRDSQKCPALFTGRVETDSGSAQTLPLIQHSRHHPLRKFPCIRHLWEWREQLGRGACVGTCSRGVGRAEGRQPPLLLFCTELSRPWETGPYPSSECSRGKYTESGLNSAPRQDTFVRENVHAAHLCEMVGLATACPVWAREQDCRRAKAAFDLRDLSAFTRDTGHASSVMAVPSLFCCIQD